MDLINERFAIERELGRGAFGRTYLARDTESDSLVAVKVFDPLRAPDLKSVELFRREADVLRSLRHQGVPAIVDYFTTDDSDGRHAVLVMEFIDGESLSQMIDAGRVLSPATVFDLLLSLLDVIDYLHSRVPPLLHRDIKPSNIIVRGNGTPVLIDFGSVRRVFMHGDESGSTIAGTYGYMPYEQYMGQASPSSDLYALAATMLHLITGRPPRDFMNDGGVLDVPDSLPGDPRLTFALRRMLMSAPSARFQSAREVRAAILHESPQALLALRSSTQSVALALPAALDDARPRPRTAELRRLLRSQSPRMIDLMDSSRKPHESMTVAEGFMLASFGLLTFGIVPLIYYAFVRARRKRLARFLSNGVATTAVVRGISHESTSFGVKVALVKYEFEVNGIVRRDADQMLPFLVRRLAPGDVMNVLYIPEQDFDSVLLA